MKTARFTNVVQRSGRPKLHLTWQTPAADKALQSAKAQNRLLTLVQETRGAKKDSGTVGLTLGRNRQYLIFPKSLRAFEGCKVVGIQYDLIEEGLSLSATPPKARSPAPKPPNKNADPKPPERRPIEAVSSSPPSLPPVVEPEETDPLLREVAKALDELADKQLKQVRGRLEHIRTLRRGEIA